MAHISHVLGCVCLSAALDLARREHLNHLGRGFENRNSSLTPGASEAAGSEWAQAHGVLEKVILTDDHMGNLCWHTSPFTFLLSPLLLSAAISHSYQYLSLANSPPLLETWQTRELVC